MMKPSSIRSSILGLVMGVFMVFTMMSTLAQPAYAASKSNFYSGADVLRDGSNTSEAATVHLAGTKWRVIGYGVSQEGGVPQVASSADTMTLIAADNLKTGVQFNPYDNQVNTYKDSNLYNEVNALTDDTNGLFSKGEKEGIVARDLEEGSYTDGIPYTNGIAGNKMEGALLWPLSTQEAYYMDSELRQASAYWWLRSPGYIDSYAAVVYGDGRVDDDGFDVNAYFGVRPAFNFNLESVIFTSAAKGGKSAAVGADSLSKVSEYMSGKEWKLTLKDDVHKYFKVNDVAKAGEGKLKIEYSDAAVDEKKEYISAIVKTNEVGGGQFASWYGKLALANSTKPECELTIPKNLEPGDEIYVFNEQCNADAITEGDTTTPAETDYASELIKVYTAPNPKITEQPAKELKLTYGNTTGNVLSVKAEVATGNTLSYQWYYKNNPSLAAGTKIDNATGASYTIPTNQNIGKTLYYYCVVTEKDQYGGEMSSRSDLAAVTVSRAKLTIKPKDQTFTYNGQLQGPADAVYAGTEVDEYVAYDKGSLKFDDKLDSITVDGQGQEAGTYDLVPSAVNIQDGKGNQVNGNYNITLENGKLTIGKAHVTITADDKSSKVGEALQELTYKVNGDYVEGDDLGITVSTDADKNKAGTYDIKAAWNNNKNYDASLVDGKYTVTAALILVPPAPKISGTLLARATAKEKALTISWNKITGAEGYDIFLSRCNYNGKKIAPKKVKTIKGNKTFSWTKTGLKGSTTYKAYVKAYVYKNGKKTYVKTSPVMHAYTGGFTKKYTNAKSVSVNKTKVTLQKGKTFKIKAQVNKLKKNKKLMPKSHAATLRYKSTNTKVASVSKAGKITAKAPGKCYIYVYAHNGVYKKVNVTVKAGTATGLKS